MNRNLKSIEEISGSYKRRTGFIITLLSISVLVLGGIIYLQSEKIKEKKIYMPTNDGIYKAVMAGKQYEKSDAIKRLHCKIFFELMFSANKSNYYERINRGLHLINREDGKRIYNEMKNEGIFDLYETYPQMHTTIKIDSITINKTVYPEEVSVYMIQYAIYPDDEHYTTDEIAPLLIAARFNLIDHGLDYEDDLNPLGFLISNFNFFQYKLNRN